MTETFYRITNIENEFNVCLDSKEDMNRLFATLKKNIVDKNSYAWSLKTKWLLPYHTHEKSKEVVVLLSGSLRYIVEEDIIDLIVGDVLCINENAVHGVVGTSKEGEAHAVLIFR